jgi:hypothetical protein
MIKGLTKIPRPLLVAPVVIAFGFLSRASFAPAFVRENVGDALYAVLVWVLLRTVFPKQSRALHAVEVLGFCTAIEFLQAVPAAPGSLLARIRALPFAALVLGRGFSVADLLRYFVGVLGASFGEALASRATPPDKHKGYREGQGESEPR